MTGTSHLRSPPLLLCAMCVALTACLGSSRPARFYTLEPLQVRDGPSSTPTDATLTVGPVELPDYVDRPQIVTRTGANELVFAEFDRWGGSLDNQINNTLVATLRDRLAPQQIAVVPWRSAIVSGGTSYRVRVSVSRFDGILGQSVVLQARWELTAQNGGKVESLGVREASVTEAIGGPEYDALAAAMQRALVRFGQQMADGVSAAKQAARTPEPAADSARR
ncbi:MAG TPA: PqiC family protein [Myxococcaceae bacterium]|nr:PqiC family protein [Myxococcaceae bacterium]